jgi:membrane protein DedA with SNARE-associated domain
MKEWFVDAITEHGYAALFALLMLGIVGLPVPDETLLVFAGYLTFKQQLSFLPAVAAAFLGSACGITLSYGVGRALGSYLGPSLGRVGLDAGKLANVRAWYQARGKYALVAGYFVPGIRHLTAFVAGSSKLPLPVFAVYAYTGGLLWTVSFLLLGFWLGDEWSRLSTTIHHSLLAVTAVAFLIVGLHLLRNRKNRKAVS